MKLNLKTFNPPFLLFLLIMGCTKEGEIDPPLKDCMYRDNIAVEFVLQAEPCGCRLVSETVDDDPAIEYYYDLFQRLDSVHIESLPGPEYIYATLDYNVLNFNGLVTYNTGTVDPAYTLSLKNRKLKSVDLTKDSEPTDIAYFFTYLEDLILIDSQFSRIILQLDSKGNVINRHYYDLVDGESILVESREISYDNMNKPLPRNFDRSKININGEPEFYRALSLNNIVSETRTSYDASGVETGATLYTYKYSYNVEGYPVEKETSVDDVLMSTTVYEYECFR